jgi:alkanesulfonate monooxygenase SsuD/methylene tetrahydromethanopterin reductase-like flavin-dependent oxidoreductase (luciferase family)
MTAPEFHLYLPQMRMTFDDIVGRAQTAEASGFTGIAIMDHLAPPHAEDQPMFEAMITATWLAAYTERMKIGHLVLCDSFRHPAVLARQAVSLDHASGGRFELGIGWGSVPAELATYGVGTNDSGARVRRLSETLLVLRALWSGEVVDFDGDFHRIAAAQQLPIPLEPIPIVIGGAGRATLELVATHADWWNVPIYATDRLEQLRPLAGNARTSIQQLVAVVPSEADRGSVTEAAGRRYGTWNSNLVTGTADDLVSHFSALCDRGVERFYVWFTDFATLPTLEIFGEVIAELRSP